MAPFRWVITLLPWNNWHISGCHGLGIRAYGKEVSACKAEAYKGESGGEDDSGRHCVYDCDCVIESDQMIELDDVFGFSSTFQRFAASEFSGTITVPVLEIVRLGCT